MTDQQQEMIEYTTQEVVGYLIEDNAITIEQAMEQFYLMERGFMSSRRIWLKQ